MPRLGWNFGLFKSGSRQTLALFVGFLLLVLSNPRLWTGTDQVLWFPPLGIGLALTAWFGTSGLLVTVGSLLLVRLVTMGNEVSAWPGVVEPILIGAELQLAWWIYRQVGKGGRRINDPRSATIYLFVVPGVIAGVTGLVFTWLGQVEDFWATFTHLWILHAISFLVLAPLLLSTLTPWFTLHGIIAPTAAENSTWIEPNSRLSFGNGIEIAGMALCSGFLGLILTSRYLERMTVNWHFWAILLLLVVWASLRQGMRGGLLAALSAALVALSWAGKNQIGDPHMVSLQGNLLAVCSTALLVGTSSGWIRASEMRYRQVVGHIPVILYTAQVRGSPEKKRFPQVQVLLVSKASKTIFACAPAELEGPHERWLERVHMEDRELLCAAIAQLQRQSEPVSCEYRLNLQYFPNPEQNQNPDLDKAIEDSGEAYHPMPRQERWVRDTLAPYHDQDGVLIGWEGVVEDITTQRILAQNLQQTSTMLHTLVASMPAGIFFVKGMMGQPVLVNARARQLLGQREDLTASISNWPRIYRLHRPDGALYPWEDLPVYRALKMGVRTMKEDIVIHRADGRQIPLIAWAAPIELHPSGKSEPAAVWVFEDMTALNQADATRLDTEARLRTIIELMAEGLVMQDDQGAILECNPAACTILGVPQEKLIGQNFPGPQRRCIRENGSPMDLRDQPDQVSLATKLAVRNVIIGIPMEPEEEENHSGEKTIRWILVNSLPMTSGRVHRAGFALRIITSFVDITAYHQKYSAGFQTEVNMNSPVNQPPPG